MGEEREPEIPAGRRHIIERPRLTRLLDDTAARVILLVAPAGYGKTTLARQWLAARQHAWYQGSAASADVAALGIGITASAATVTDQVGRRFREWLLTRRGVEGADIAAEFLADDLRDWPPDAWLAIDDYQWLTRDAEETLSRVVQLPGFRLLITSRRRPLWATPRSLLYGEIYEIGQSALAMSQDEGSEVLAEMLPDVARGLLALADGWPAVIGLASFADAPSFLRTDSLPPALHDFVADELYASVDPAMKPTLAEISLLPVPSASFAAKHLGAKGIEAIREGVRVGFLTEGHAATFDLHPLLRAFLRRKLTELPESALHDVVSHAIGFLIRERSCEGAFDLIVEYNRLDFLDDLIRVALYELLNEGRLSTVGKFIALGRAHATKSPVLDLADAELAFRQGYNERARALAECAGRGLERDPSLAPKALVRAGQSAYFSDDAEGAIRHFRRAREIATDQIDEQSAIWGHFIAAVELEYDQARRLLQEFEQCGSGTIDDATRVHNGRLHLATRMGRLLEAVSGAGAIADLVAQATDPVVRTSFWHVYGGALRLASRYDDGLEATDNALNEIETFQLDFARGHVYLTRAGIKLGLGQTEEVDVLLDDVEELAKRRNDLYLQMNERTTRCRLHLLQGDVEQALAVTESTWPHVPSSGQYAELLASRSIALTKLGDYQQARGLREQAAEISRESEATTLCKWAQATAALERDDGKADPVGLFRETLISGVFDPFVFACRVEPRLLECIAQAVDLHRPLHMVLTRARYGMAVIPAKSSREFGGDDVSEMDELTRREREVFALLAQSKTNREIAQLLFLSEATVKVHVRHILRKLGVRTRTEAAVRAARMPQRPGLGQEVANQVPSRRDSLG